jgi:hypothetical protein
MSFDLLPVPLPVMPIWPQYMVQAKATLEVAKTIPTAIVPPKSKRFFLRFDIVPLYLSMCSAIVVI